MSEPFSGGTDQCDRCEETADPDLAPRTDHELCQQCVREIRRESAREGERGQGQRTIGEQNAVDRWTRYPSSEEVGRNRSVDTDIDREDEDGG
jgi:hypothetical protein